MNINEEGVFATREQAVFHIIRTLHPSTDFDVDSIATRMVVGYHADASVDGIVWKVEGDIALVAEEYRLFPTVPDAVDELGKVTWRAGEPRPAFVEPLAPNTEDPRLLAAFEREQSLRAELVRVRKERDDESQRARGLLADLEGAGRRVARLLEEVDAEKLAKKTALRRLEEREAELAAATLDTRNGEGRANENSARITELNRQVDEQTRRINELIGEKDVAEEALAAFKHQVRVIATDEAEKHDWCPEVDRVLARLGLTRISFVYTARVEVDIDIRVTRPLSSKLSETPNEDAVSEMLLGHDAIDAAIRRHLNIDEEHTDFDVDDIVWSVQEVIEAETE